MTRVMYIQDLDTLTGFFQQYKTMQRGAGRGLRNALRTPSHVISTGRSTRPILIDPTTKTVNQAKEVIRREEEDGNREEVVPVKTGIKRRIKHKSGIKLKRRRSGNIKKTSQKKKQHKKNKVTAFSQEWQ